MSDALQSSPVFSNDTESVKRAMIERVAHRVEHFDHLRQRDEPDLSLDERRMHVEKLLTNNPGEFLARFGSTITLEDLMYFDTVCLEDYVVKFRTAEIRQGLNDTDTGGKVHHAVVKNRRYEAMHRLESLGKYFSDEEMKRRDPLLYEEMIGQHMTEDDAKAMSAPDKVPQDHALSEALLEHIQAMQNNELYEQLKDAEECQMEEDEESDDDDEHDEGGEDIGDTESLSNYDKAVLRNEFIEIMKQRFLDGKDDEFDYSEVDNNTDYDALEQVSRDAEDKYFNDDDSSEQSDIRSQPVTDYDY